MDVPVHEEDAADVEVILLTEVNDSFSTVSEITYSKLFHDSFSVLVASYPCVMVSKQEQDAVSWNVVNCHLQ